MVGAFAAMIVILSVFFGLGFVIAVVMSGVMLATGRWTLPGSPERRLKHAEVNEQVSQLRKSTILAEEQIEMIMHTRMTRAIEQQSKGEGDEDSGS